MPKLSISLSKRQHRFLRRMDANTSRAVQILIDERTNVQRPLIDLKRIAHEINELLQDELAEDGTYEATAIEIDVADLECWRDSILAAQGQ